MPIELTALKVRIGLNDDGSAKYPPFQQLPVVQAAGINWSRYVDVQGMGWLYDKVAGHADDDAQSPRGIQWGLLLVPEQFAIEAVANFPSECARMTEAQTEAFYDNRVAVGEEEDIEDEIALQALERKLRLLDAIQNSTELLPVTEYEARRIKILRQIKRALDPTSRTRGVRENHRATWQKRKQHDGITFKEEI